MDEPDIPQPEDAPVPPEPAPEEAVPGPPREEPEENQPAEAAEEGARFPDEAADRGAFEERLPSEAVEEGGALPEEGPRVTDPAARRQPSIPEDEALSSPDEPAPMETVAEARPDYLLTNAEESHPAEESPPGISEEIAEVEKVEVAQEHEGLARENAAHLEREIDELRTGHEEGGRRQYRSFFEHERRLHQLFKELRPLHTAERHRLWSTFKQIGAEARRQQQEEWEARRYLSIEARETVEEKIRSAESLMQGAGAAEEYRRADGILNEVRSLLSSESAGSPGQVLIGPDRRACWDRWREVRDALRRQRSGMQEQDYKTLADLVTEVVEGVKTEDPFRSVQRVKELQAQLGKAYLRRGQFEELRRRLSEAWQAAQVRIAEQRQERTRRRAEWRDRMEGHLSRWKETLEHRRSQREHLVQQMEKLDGMEKNARSEDFAVQVRGWKDETAEKLRRVEEFILDLEQRIGSATKKVGGRGPRESREHRPGGEAPGPEAS